MFQNFKDLYYSKIREELKKEFNYTNVHQIPKIEKIVLHMGCGDAVKDSKVINSVIADLAAIAGQKPVISKAKKSIAAFKLREGMPLGCKVTLRKDRMYDFLERLVVIALPRVKQFRGVSIKNLDGKGNLNLGIKEHIIFAEIDYDKITKIRGMDINIITSAVNDQEAKGLLSKFQIPFF